MNAMQEAILSKLRSINRRARRTNTLTTTVALTKELIECCTVVLEVFFQSREIHDKHIAELEARINLLEQALQTQGEINHAHQS
jgi:hypothetical protein